MRSSTWAKTGIVALRDAGLTSLPEELWAASSHAQILDLTNNSLESLPEEMAQLNRLQKLSLSRNRLTDVNNGLASMFQQLQVLNLSHYRQEFCPRMVIKHVVW